MAQLKDLIVNGVSRLLNKLYVDADTILGTASTSSNHTLTVNGKVVINPSYNTASNSFNEGVIINQASNNWAEIVLGGANGYTAGGVAAGHWLIARRGAAGSYVGVAGDFNIGDVNEQGGGLTLHKNNGGATIYANCGQDVGTLNLRNINSLTSGTSWPLNAVMPNMSAGTSAVLLVGQGNSTRNGAYIGFKYSGSGSNDNYLKLGLYGADDLMIIKGNGNVGIGTTNPLYHLDVSGTGRFTSRIYSNEWIQFDNYSGLYSPLNGAHFYPNNTTTYGQWKILGSKGGYSGIQFGDNSTYMTVMDNGNDKGFYQGSNGIWPFYYNRSENRIGIRSYDISSGYSVQVNGSLYITDVLRTRGPFYVGGNANGYDYNYIAFYGVTGDSPGEFNHTYIGENLWGGSESSELVLFKGNDVGNGSSGIDVSSSGPDRIRHIAAAHVFQTYNNAFNGSFYDITHSSTPSTRFQIAHDAIISHVKLIISSGNIWLSTANLQLHRTDTTAYSDRACIGATDGNLHLDPYSGHNIYLNYYNPGRVYFNGPSYYIEGSYYNGRSAASDRADYLGNDNTDWMRFHWSGNGGQPTWLWGSNDGVNNYLWNPSNFSVSNADTVDGYHASSLWRSDGATWNVSANVTCSGNGEWSFDITDTGSGSAYWHVWSGNQGRSMLKCYPYSSYVYVPVHLSVGYYTHDSYALSTSSFICSDWIRTTGATGWYNESYYGGWYMSDSSWIRNYNNKGIYLSKQAWSTSANIYNAHILFNPHYHDQPSSRVYNSWFGGRDGIHGYGYGNTINIGAFHDNNPDSSGLYIGMSWDDNNSDTFFIFTRYGTFRANAVEGAVWNDYAEYRQSSEIKPGYVLYENGDDTLSPTTERLQHFAGISSDTYGFAQGETEQAKTPIAVAGRVLVYPLRDRNDYKPGDCVCAAPGGKVDIMTREEVKNYPDRIVGTVSCIPTYTLWGGGGPVFRTIGSRSRRTYLDQSSINELCVA